MVDATDRRQDVAAARERFLATGSAAKDGVAAVIAASWRRSAEAGVDAIRSQATFHSDLDISSRLVRCSRPIIDRLREATEDIPLSIALTDGKARLLARIDTSRSIGLMLDNVSFAPGYDYAEGGVGTNGVGTVFESGQPIQIAGPEHFHEHLQPFACSGAPIRDPLTGRIDGALDISCLTEHSNPLMHSMVRSAAREIERNLLIDRSPGHQAVFQTFVRTDARTRGAVMAVGGGAVMTNAVAQSLLTPVEQAMIQDHVRYLTSRQDRVGEDLELSNGKVVRIRGKRILVGNDAAGMVIEIALLAEASPTPGLTVSEQPIPAVAVHNGAPRSMPVLLTSSTPSGSMQSTSQSTLWNRACHDVESALASHRALLVMGEPGTGRFTLVEEIYRRLNPGGRCMVIQANDISRRSIADADADLALGPTTAPTLYIFRNIDELSAEGVRELHRHLSTVADSDRPVYSVATLTDANIEADLPFRDLLVHFQQAVTVPPLRHRSEDIPTVVAQVVDKIAGRRQSRVGAAALRVICRYDWPRNIAQLEEALAAALVRRPVGEIQPEDLPGYCHGSARRQLSGMEALERDAIVKALRDAHGNRLHAAAALGIARSSLYRKLRAFGISTV
jgi:transcriptional regulator of acetoin/glycerol metabolism